MATTTSTVPAVIDALKAALDARGTPAMAGVVVTTAPSGEPVPFESIQFFGTNEDQSWAALGNRRRRETYTLLGAIYIKRLGAGAEIWDAVRERAYALLAELEDELRTNPTLGLGSRVLVQLASANLGQGIEPNVRVAALDLGLACSAELVSD